MRAARKVWLSAVVVAATATTAFADERTADPFGDGNPPCFDTSDVVGYRSCPAYGSWGDNLLAPYVFVQIELNVRHFAAAAEPRASVAARTESPVSTTSAGRVATTYDERFGVALTDALYTALDVELGNFPVGTPPQSDPELVLGALASIGLQQRIGPITLNGELAGGVLATSTATDTALQPEAVIEARARADLWLGPWCTLGALIGRDLLRQGEWMYGFNIGFHSHTYGRR